MSRALDIKVKNRGRALIALLLLCAMLLCACGSIAEPEGQHPLPSTDDPSPTEPGAEPTPSPAPTPDMDGTDVVLSELCASNKSGPRDEDGDFCDWIELYNSGGKSCDIGGLWLSDDPGEPQKWQLPQRSLAPGEYLVIFASGKDRKGEELHTDFRLSSSGDTLVLSSPQGYPLWQFSYDECGKDTVFRVSGGESTVSYYPTPGYPNTEEGYEEYIAAADDHGALVINEAVTYNDDFNKHAGEYFDWIELKNDSSEVIDLSDYYITDDASEPFAFQLPNKTLAPGNTFVVFCGEPASPTASCHAPFKLSSKGDAVYLYRADGSLCDCVGLYNVPLNGSKGRIKGQSGFFLFAKRTPAAANAAGARYQAAKPVSVTPSGVHNGVEYLEVELSGEGTIYYTTNGADPSIYTEKYTGPIKLSKTTVIRAICVADGRLTSRIASYTYVINENHTLPVVCVSLDPKKFDVLYNHNTYMEYDSTAEYYGDDGSFYSECMITMHGASARTVWAKKNFKVVFKDRYGGDIHFDLFGSGITEFHALVLRGGDSVGMHTFREPMAAVVAERVAVQDPMALDSRFCVLYVNGRYWGLYTLREAYSKQYVASHTGSDEELCSISRAPIKIEYQPELFALHNFISTCNINDPDNYAYIADRFDLESLAQWMCLEAYYNNHDPTGNIRYCIGNRPDGKWRTMLFDLDIAFNNTDANIYPVIDTGSQIGRMTTNLLRSPEFRQLLLETASQLYKNGLRHELLLEVFNEMVETVEPEMDRNLSRWGESRVLYDHNLVWQRSLFGEARDQSWLRVIQNITGADDETMREYFPERQD